MAELGEELRRERVRRNLTFKDIEQVLHIKTTYLEAIEDGNYAVIPGRVYAKDTSYYASKETGNH